MKWNNYDRRINKIPILLSDLICVLAAIQSFIIYIHLIYKILSLAPYHFIPSFSWSLFILPTLFFYWMFMDVSGNKYIKDKNAWLGFLCLFNGLAAPIYYLLIYRKTIIENRRVLIKPYSITQANEIIESNSSKNAYNVHSIKFTFTDIIKGLLVGGFILIVYFSFKGIIYAFFSFVQGYFSGPH